MKIALVGLSPLAALGMCALVDKIFGNSDVSTVTADCGMPSAESPGTPPAWQQADCHIVSARALANNARFFMPRLDRILLLTESAITDGNARCGIPMISPSAPHKDLVIAIERLIAMSNASRSESHPASLTPRETDVLRLTALGLTSKEIASQLYISVNTVLTHRKNISAKLGLRTASALTHYAMVHGLTH